MECSPRFPLIVPCREDFCGLANIDHVMRNSALLCGCGFGCSNIEMAKDLDRIVVYDLTGKTLSQKKRQLRFTAGCWPNNSNNWVHDRTGRRIFPSSQRRGIDYLIQLL